MSSNRFPATANETPRALAEFDHPTRGSSYGHANDEIPSVRHAEIAAAMSALAPAADERIVEFGAGNGLLTREIADAVGPRGEVVALDNSRNVLAMLAARVPAAQPILIDREQTLPLPSRHFDAIASLANFHHVTDKAALMREFARVLKDDGRIIIADVHAGTRVAVYFDEVVDAICSTGHKHRFVDWDWMEELASSAGLEIVSWDVRDVPWSFDVAAAPQFASPEAMAGWYLKTIHDASLGADACLELASRYLRLTKSGAAIALEWSLVFCCLRGAPNR